MSGNVIPIGDEQSKAIAEASKAIAEALKALHGIAGFLKETFGTVPKISPPIGGRLILEIDICDRLACASKPST